MAGFSTKERLAASLLSTFPGLKKHVKWIYIKLNAVIYKKNYTSKIDEGKVSEIMQVEANGGGETFFGYYDKPCSRKGNILFHRTIQQPTIKQPSATTSIDIIVRTDAGKEITIGTTCTYNWQQGARAQWLDDDKVIYNCLKDDHYGAKVYSISGQKVISEFDMPVQDSFRNNYFLSINYSRIMKLRADYGYRNLPLPSEIEMEDLRNDGIFKVDYLTRKFQLIHSLKDIVALQPKTIFTTCNHVVNHVMIRPDGKGFIFIHRYYQGKRRFDRLIYSDFKQMKVLVDDKMVSHCCWVDNSTILGYFRYNGRDAFYECNIDSANIKCNETMSQLRYGDGHPSCYGNLIVFDTYPDKSRMQHLFLYDRNTDAVYQLLEVYQSTAYMNECRCDLHPRFSDDGKHIFFDTVYSGNRQLCYVTLKNSHNE